MTTEEIEALLRDGHTGPMPLSGQADQWRSPSYKERVAARVPHLAQPDRRDQHLVSRSLVDLATDPAVLAVVRAFLGPDLLLWVAHHLPKAPGAAGAAWHVDATNLYVRGLHVSIALDEVDEAAGCLKVVSGSHRYRTSLWAQEEACGLDRRSDADVLALADASAPWAAPHTARSLPLGAGEFLLTLGGLWHAVHDNRSPTTRLTTVARFARPDFAIRRHGFRDDRIDPGPAQPSLLVSGRDPFGLNALRSPPMGDVFS